MDAHIQQGLCRGAEAHSCVYSCAMLLWAVVVLRLAGLRLVLATTPEPLLSSAAAAVQACFSLLNLTDPPELDLLSPSRIMRRHSAFS